MLEVEQADQLLQNHQHFLESLILDFDVVFELVDQIQTELLLDDELLVSVSHLQLVVVIADHAEKLLLDFHVLGFESAETGLKRLCVKEEVGFELFEENFGSDDFGSFKVLDVEFEIEGLEVLSDENQEVHLGLDLVKDFVHLQLIVLVVIFMESHLVLWFAAGVAHIAHHHFLVNWKDVAFHPVRGYEVGVADLCLAREVGQEENN